MPGINLSYLTGAAAIINFIFGLFVLSKGSERNSLNVWFFIFTLLVSVWALNNFLFEVVNQSLSMFRGSYSTGGLMLVGSLPWIWILTEGKLESKKLSTAIGLGAVAFLVPLIDGYVIEDIYISANGKYSFESGILFDYYGAFLFVLLGYLLIKLYKSYKLSSGPTKFQLAYTLAGISVFAAVSFTFGVILPLFNYKPVVAFDAQSSLFWVGLTAYAITRHRLFDIKTIATQVFLGLLLVLILGRLITADSVGDLLFESIIFTFALIVGYYLVRSVEAEVERRSEVERLAGEKTKALDELAQRNKNLATLQKISQLVLNENELRPMVQAILNEIPKQLDSCRGALLNLTKSGKIIGYSITETEFSKKIFSLVGEDLEKYSEPLEKGYNLIHDSLLYNRTMESNKLVEFVSPPIPSAIAMTLQKLIGIKYILAVPLYSGTHPLGVMMFTYRLPKDQLDSTDIDMSKAIADDMSLAIQRAEAFERLKDANEYLAQLDKMKDEFISMASHELNTPLAAIEGYLSMVLDEGMGKVDQKSKVYLTRAYDSSKRLAELIMDLLNVSRIEQGRLKMKFAKSNLLDLAESVIRELQIRADERKLYLKIEGDKAQVPDTWCDPDRIREVIVNLVGNAIKFTDKGGVTIKVERVENNILTSVIDTGRGIAAADQSKLFQKFSQIHREIDEQRGTGLGLYISKNFIELHDGELKLESELGKGSTFSFELPILDKAPEKVSGAILDGRFSAPQIEVDNQDQAPAVVTDSVKAN